MPKGKQEKASAVPRLETGNATLEADLMLLRNRAAFWANPTHVTEDTKQLAAHYTRVADVVEKWREYAQGNQDGYRTLQPFDEAYVRMLREVNALVAKMNDAQLAELKTAITGPTTTNCGWTLYQVLPLVKEAITHRAFESLKEG